MPNVKESPRRQLLGQVAHPEPVLVDRNRDIERSGPHRAPAVAGAVDVARAFVAQEGPLRPVFAVHFVCIHREADENFGHEQDPRHGDDAEGDQEQAPTRHARRGSYTKPSPPD